MARTKRAPKDSAVAEKAVVFNKLPGVFSFSRRIVMSDVSLFNEIDGDTHRYPVEVIRHGIAGTQNVNKDVDKEVRNVQMTESAKLDPRADALIARFSMRFLPIAEGLHACAPSKGDEPEVIRAVTASVNSFTKRAISEGGIKEIAYRYARNILNGRWLWHNRAMAMNIGISVTENGRLRGGEWQNDRELIQGHDALKTPMNHFNDYTENEIALGDVIAQCLANEQEIALNIEARIDFGIRGALEIKSSENYLADKPKGFSRSLYCLGRPAANDKTTNRVMGFAAIRDQKAGNAIRTIDTWYEGYEETGRPISIEPNGANLSDNVHYRPIRSGQSAFKLFAKLNAISPSSKEGLFALASLVRGGVYSEAAK